MLRDYQQRSIDQLYDWMRSNSGHPCLVLPTGSGKSHIVAALCKDALQNWPETQILMLTHVKELIQQNAEKLRQHWPNAPLGIYSAGLGSKRLDAITYAGIQSVRNKAALIGHVDLVIIDECHLVSHRAEGGYRMLLEELTKINPRLRVVGLTATPYRLGHGLITDDPALFDGLIEPVSIEELIYKGYLAPLRSKITTAKISADGVHKRGGEYIESELQAAVDRKEINGPVVDEIIAQSEGRKSWLIFCVGVDHSYNIRNELRDRGISAETITGETPKGERARIIADFKAGRITALTNANVLTTGFDHPDTDLLCLLRPTMSPSLYVQMAGRGMRPKSHTDHCKVLDFAGVIQTHGPITNVDPGRKAGNGEAPVKVCPECDELVHISVMTCPTCGYDFPPPEPKQTTLYNQDIMGMDGDEMNVANVQWRIHTSYTSGKEMLKATYYGTAISDPMIHEYLTILHDGYAGEKARRTLGTIAQSSGVQLADAPDFYALPDLLNDGIAPSWIKYQKDGKFYRILERKWHED